MRHRLSAAPRDVAGQNDGQRKNRISKPSARSRITNTSSRHHDRKNGHQSQLCGNSRTAPGAMPWPIRSVIGSAIVPLAKKCRRVRDMMMVGNRARFEPRNSMLAEDPLDTH